MSRSGYSDDYDDPLQCGRWRAVVASATRGKPEKKLISGHLEKEGSVCALGALGRHRGVDMAAVDTHAWDQLGETFNIARQLAQEVMYENDDGWYHNNEEGRWEHVRSWAARQIVPTEDELGGQEPIR